MDINKILCPIDPQARTALAVRYGIALAHVCEAKMVVCGSLGAMEYAVEEARHRVEGELIELVMRLVPGELEGKIDWEVVVVEGDAALSVVEEARRQGVDLMVVESRRRPFAAALFGSTVEAICRESECPVLVLHTDERDWEGLPLGEIALKRILVAQDFSPAGESASACASALAQEYQTEFHLLHVMPRDYRMRPGEMQFIEEQMERLISPEARLWCPVKPVVRTGKAAEEILAYAREQASDLICVGRHGEAGGAGEIFGSTTDRILRMAGCPVLVAPGRASLGERPEVRSAVP